ncbi:hypothetical protein BD311DRAFT_175640 [Dichomitus squalens]|uniref:Uncharacterized protein n=1 Tax=Dichomitus squalens TaxID=114155 RepID=A0A4Q9MT98_9APHY|nr:hypothetical protein BD311DRAFT_175640 [Dichomitus squalens]
MTPPTNAPRTSVSNSLVEDAPHSLCSHIAKTQRTLYSNDLSASRYHTALGEDSPCGGSALQCDATTAHSPSRPSLTDDLTGKALARLPSPAVSVLRQG